MTDAGTKSRPVQFSLRHVLLAMGAVCVVLALYRAAGAETATAVLIVGLPIGVSVLGIIRRDWTVAALALLLLSGVCMCLPSISPPKVYTRKMACANNLKQFAVALHTYHDRYGTFPPAYIADENGKPMHSWRVLILPEMEQQQLYDQYRFDEPWDGPNNRKLHQQTLPYIACAAASHNRPLKPGTETHYVVVVGPKTAFPGDKCVALSDITDNHGNTILVVEVESSGIHWMEPRDLHVTQMARQINPAKGQGISSGHKGGGAHVAMADGSVEFLGEKTLTPAEIQSLLTIDGNEPPPQGWRH